jgi:molybdopterin synthase sulfur carrier subunit
VQTTHSITVLLPGILRDYCGGRNRLVLEASDVRSMLAALEQESGAPRRHLNLFVNSDNTRDLSGLDTTLGPGDVVTILPAVSGG